MKTPNAQLRPADKAKQILYVWNYLEWGGVQTYFLGLMRSASPKYRVKAILPNGSESKILRYLEASRVEYDFYEGRIDLSEAVTIPQKIKRRVNDFLANLSLAKHLSRYDLKNSAVQIDVAPWTGFFLLLYLVLKTNVFVTLHTAVSETSFFREILWKFKLAILGAFKNFHLNASNRDVKKSVRRLVGASLDGRMEVIYSSFNAAELETSANESRPKQEIAETYNFPADKIWIAAVGQFIERKGCWILLEAIEILGRRREDLFFCWLGTAPLDAPTLEKIRRRDTKNSFRFLPAVEIGAHRSDLLTLWQATDIFVLPSFQEGLPMALIEASALGKPCIASNINAVPEAVEHLETGILVDAGDAAQLARAIERLADDAELRKRLGDNARKAAYKNYEEKNTGRQMLRLYENSFLEPDKSAN